MAGKARRVARGLLDLQAHQQRQERERVDRTIARQQTPTFPRYPDEPADAVETQIAFLPAATVGASPSGFKPMYFEDGDWHDFGEEPTTESTAYAIATVATSYTNDGTGGNNRVVWDGGVESVAFDVSDIDTPGTAAFVTQLPGLYQVNCGGFITPENPGDECVLTLNAIKSTSASITPRADGVTARTTVEEELDVSVLCLPADVGSFFVMSIVNLAGGGTGEVTITEAYFTVFKVPFTIFE